MWIGFRKRMWFYGKKFVGFEENFRFEKHLKFEGVLNLIDGNGFDRRK